MSGLLLICSALKRVVLKITAVVCSVFSIRVLILATKIKKTCHECGTHLEIIWEGKFIFCKEDSKNGLQSIKILRRANLVKMKTPLPFPYHHLIRERKHSWKLNSVLCPNQVISLWYKHNRVKG
uniref:Putative uncharacterized protein YPR077C n=1 Tax=Saccharomyces cerevisiae (strain ATCC 204508 / S288c) TaxID=559292 RepID=YPR77_YEAST|nr:RecName: Full=Putative uncharacterized protein YPR077C [Saccharomyces cerevisiae S288C]AAB68144.1 Ypr077cp [Saccharomyces cerevisiae]AAT93299.1 YPR077C [Saccharomyces cerevisiae]